MFDSDYSWSQQKGYTLVELLVSLLITSITVTAMITFFHFQTINMRVENARRAAQMTARGTLNFIVRELEHIGRDPSRTLFTAANPALQEADEDTLHYRTDLNADWDLTPDLTSAWEDVTFQYNPDAWTIEIVRGGNAVALTDDRENQRSYVPAGGLSFIYFKADGTVVPPGSGATDRAKVRRINISVTIRGVPPDGHEEPEVTLSQDVILRNVS